ncbi:hypothetical protein F5Y10DRAFT_293638 [Nemania abortiva]|nr:hypothetical protein F5Y10DRAFT_293638 [Nemania abortiva]
MAFSPTYANWIDRGCIEYEKHSDRVRDHPQDKSKMWIEAYLRNEDVQVPESYSDPLNWKAYHERMDWLEDIVYNFIWANLGHHNYRTAELLAALAQSGPIQRRNAVTRALSRTHWRLMDNVSKHWADYCVLIGLFTLNDFANGRSGDPRPFLAILSDAFDDSRGLEDQEILRKGAAQCVFTANKAVVRKVLATRCDLNGFGETAKRRVSLEDWESWAAAFSRMGHKTSEPGFRGVALRAAEIIENTHFEQVDIGWPIPGTMLFSFLLRCVPFGSSIR